MTVSDHVSEYVGPLPEISIRQLEYLVAVADHPTWAVAAESVGVSASALSQGLSELERRIGVNLFDSAGRRRVVRADALPVLDHARRMLALTSDLARWSRDYRHGRQGQVRLGMIDTAAVSYYPDIVRSFRLGHDDVDLRLVVAPSATLVDQLRDDAIDIAICVAPATTQFGLTERSLRTDEVRVIAPAGEPIEEPNQWGPWVMFPASSHTRRLVVDRLRVLGARLDTAAESHQPEVLAEMVHMGIGWAVLPVPDPSLFKSVQVGPVVVERRLVLMTRADAIVSPAQQSLIEAFLNASF